MRVIGPPVASQYSDPAADASNGNHPHPPVVKSPQPQLPAETEIVIEPLPTTEPASMATVTAGTPAGPSRRPEDLTNSERDEGGEVRFSISERRRQREKAEAEAEAAERAKERAAEAAEAKKAAAIEAAAEAEKQASGKLKAALLLEVDNPAAYTRRLNEIIEKWPKTKAAEEAKRRLSGGK